jgi:ABC-type antimicrobial peptide transport system permease subunit
MEEIVTPSIVSTIGGMWDSSMNEGGSRDGVYMFQQRLREIPGWNATMISNKTREITYLYPYFEDLIAACIIAQLKIMSSIKLSQEKPTVQLKLPSAETFLHEVYVQTAKRVYEDPFMLQTRQSFETVLAPVVSDAIEKTIRKLIPFRDVLVAYLQNGGDQAVAEQAMKTKSDDSSGGSFPDRQQAYDNESDTDSSDSELRVPVNDENNENNNDNYNNNYNENNNYNNENNNYNQNNYNENNYNENNNNQTNAPEYAATMQQPPAIQQPPQQQPPQQQPPQQQPPQPKDPAQVSMPPLAGQSPALFGGDTSLRHGF